MKRNMGFYIGLIILICFAVIAILAPVISPYNPYDLGDPYLKPSSEHILGTNDVGQDILSELLYGTRVSLSVGVVSAAVVTVVGCFVGISSGYYGGLYDSIVMRITSVIMAIPSLPITIVLVAYLDASLWNIIIVICLTAWTSTARIVRAKVMTLREMPFIKSEKALGAGTAYIMVKHIIPNLSEIVFIRAVLAIAGAMLTEASLSFLGLGVIGQKSWGGILHYAYYRNGILNNYYWWYLPPIICISLSVLAFLLLGNSEKRKVVTKGC